MIKYFLAFFLTTICLTFPAMGSDSEPKIYFRLRPFGSSQSTTTKYELHDFATAFHSAIKKYWAVHKDCKPVIATFDYDGKPDVSIRFSRSNVDELCKDGARKTIEQAVRHIPELPKGIKIVAIYLDLDYMGIFESSIVKGIYVEDVKVDDDSGSTK